MNKHSKHLDTTAILGRCAGQLLLVISLLLPPSLALAQSSDDYSAASNYVINNSLGVLSQACKGHKPDNIMHGVNPADDQRCQILNVLVVNCGLLANEAGGYQREVIGGQTTYDQIIAYAWGTPNAGSIAQAAALAKLAGPNVSPGTVTKTVYAACMSTINIGASAK